VTDGFTGLIAGLAVRSLLREAEAGPKPGLVDRFGPGAHADMDISHFRLSAAALWPFFALMVTRHAPEALRNLGMEAEAAMLAATGGVNTHKGAIWTLGLLCAATGTLAVALAAGTGSTTDLTAESVCDEAASLARLIVALPPNRPPLQTPHPHPAPDGTTQPPVRQPTNGQAAKGAYGLRSARDEALAGFPAIRARALPLARSLRGSHTPEDERVITVLLGAMAACDDTCLVARGGIEALGAARRQAATVLDAGGPASADGAALYAAMVDRFLVSRLSPGGAADLCAAALFLTDLETACLSSA